MIIMANTDHFEDMYKNYTLSEACTMLV